MGFGFNHVINILNFKDGVDGGGTPMLYSDEVALVGYLTCRQVAIAHHCEYSEATGKPK